MYVCITCLDKGKDIGMPILYISYPVKLRKYIICRTLSVVVNSDFQNLRISVGKIENLGSFF